MNDLTGTIEFFLKTHNLLDEKIIVAFSGGYDSMCLLDICHKLSLDIIAIHLNHNWRAQESLDDENVCRDFCKKNNIEFYSETLPDDIEKTETKAREARYEFFRRAAEKFNSKCVLTAHNADDNAETVLYRIIKGTGVFGLDGIREKRDIFYRPMLSIYRCDIEKYCHDNGLTPVVDSSNNDIKYKRNLIRQKIIPIMQTINKDVKPALNSLSKIAQEENAVIDEFLPDVFNIDTSEFLRFSDAMQKRIVHKILKNHNIDYDKEKIENIRNFLCENSCSKSGKTISLTTDLQLFVNDKKIETVTKTEIQTEIEIPKSGQYGNFSIEECTQPPEKFPKDTECTAYVNLQDITFPLTLRTRNNGDTIQPLGMSGSQKLKQYLNDRKIPNHEKSNMLFLCKNDEILWVPGYGLSEKIKVIDKPTHMLKLLK